MLALAFFGAVALAQEPSQTGKDDLRARLAEANTSEIEVLRVIESYLKAHPDTAFRPDLEHRAALAAAAIHDDPAVVRYGEASLALMPTDSQLLPLVTRSLLAVGSREAAERALIYARRTEDAVRRMQKDGNPGNVNPIEWRNQTDLLWNRALVDQARAIGIMGRADEALAAARHAFEVYPDAWAAREIAFWYEKLGKRAEAIGALADAFAIPDAHASDSDRAKDRAHLGELYRQTKGSEDGLGALCLEAYDRTAGLVKSRRSLLELGEPNAGRTDVMEFTLSALEGESLRMSTLKGKVVVMDLWATWCVPCRAQHPLYEEVQGRFRDDAAVVFLSVDAEPDHQPVKPFVSAMNWRGPVYFEDGLARLYGVEGLPATLILDRSGKLFTHLNGVVDKGLFVDVLTERIREALKGK